jgi:hypothetical protein
MKWYWWGLIYVVTVVIVLYLNNWVHKRMLKRLEEHWNETARRERDGNQN